MDKSASNNSNETDHEIESDDHEDDLCDEDQSEVDFNREDDSGRDTPLDYDGNSGFEDDDYPENQEFVRYKGSYNTTNPMLEISCNDKEKATTVTPSQK